MPVAKSSHSVKIIIKPTHIQGVAPILFSPIITEFSDTWSPKWSATNVYGRNDPMPFFQGTSRQLTLGFRVISDSTAEASKNMQRISSLIQAQYPSYTTPVGMAASQKTKRLKSPPYFSFKFLNIVGGSKELQGYINGPININPGFQSKAQTQYFSGVGTSKKIYFSDVKIALKIQVMHEELIGFAEATTDAQAMFTDGKYPYEAPYTSATTVTTTAAGSSPVAPPTMETLNDPLTAPTISELNYLIKSQERKKSLVDAQVLDNLNDVLKSQT